MANSFYEHSGYPPGSRARNSSQKLRAEFSAIEAGAQAIETALALKADAADVSAVDNTSDADKPISTLTQAALDLKADYSALVDFDPATAGANRMLVTNATGDGWEYPSITAAGKALLDDANAAAQRTTLGLGNVDNTSDTNKPVSTMTQTALNLKANLASPSFTGNPQVPTQAYELGAADSSAKAASTAYVNNRIAELTKLLRGTTWLQMFPSGLLVQVGVQVASSTAGDEVTVMFSQPFTTSAPFVLVSGRTDNASSNSCWVTYVDIMFFKFRASLASQSVTWIALGYASIGDDV